MRITASHRWKLGIAAGLLVMHAVCLKALTSSPTTSPQFNAHSTAIPIRLIAEAQPVGNLLSAASDPGNFLPSTAMDRRPVPVSEPDVRALQGLTTSGLPVRLRIYIDRFGTVVNVETLKADLLDEEFALGLHKMFRQTAFLPGQLNGSDVASFLDIELVGRR